MHGPGLTLISTNYIFSLTKLQNIHRFTHLLTQGSYTSMSSAKTGEKAQLTVNKPTANTDTSHPTDKPASFPWTSLSQEEILHEIQKGIKNLTGPNKDSLKLLLPSAIDTKVDSP